MQGQDAITKLFQGMYASALTAWLVDCGTLIISLCHPCLFPLLTDYIDYDTWHTIRLGVAYCNNIAALLIAAYAVYSVTRLFMTERASFASDPGQAVCSLDSSHDEIVGVPPTNYKSDWQLYEEEMMEWFHGQGSSFIAFSDKDLARQRWLRVEEETIKWFHSRDKTLSLFSHNHRQTIQGLLARQRWLRIEEETIDWLNSRDRSLPLFSLNHHHTIQGLLAEQRRKEQERKEQEHKEQERKDQERKEQERKEQQRKDQERREKRRKVQQRIEQWRKERQRKEQQRRDLTRQWFEGAHKEMLKSIQDGSFPFKFNQDDSITPLVRHQSNEEVLEERCKEQRGRDSDLVADNKSLSQAVSNDKVDKPLSGAIAVVFDQAVGRPVSRPVETCSILRKPRYTNTIDQDRAFVPPQSKDEANELWNSFASCKSYSSPSRPRLQFRSDLDHPERVQTDVRLMYTGDKQYELERQMKLEAISLVNEARDDIEAEEEAEEQLARDRAQWVLELDTCRDSAICQLAGLFNDAERVPLQSQASELQSLERAPVRRSRRLAALRRVDYSLAKRSVRRSPRLFKLTRVDYKE